MFDTLWGNIGVKYTLRRLLEGGRVPNSLLFAGPDGVGKRQFAYELARAILCPLAVDHESCGVCSVCVRISAFEFPERVEKHKDEFRKVFFGGHIDAGIVVPYKRTILVDAIRDLERHAAFNPFEGKARFFIIDDADLMNVESSNALLKTLEEPTETSYIFLITSRPDSLLPTIRSRCQTIWFAPVSAADIEQYLITERAFTHHEAQVASAVARGSIGRAVAVSVDEYRTKCERMIGVIRNVVVTGDITSLLRASEELNDAKNKDAFEQDLDILESLIHDLWRYSIAKERMSIVNSAFSEQLLDLAREAETTQMAAWLGLIESMRRSFAVNINRKVAMDAMFVAAARR